MKILLTITFLISSLASCRNTHSSKDREQEVLAYDTIIIDNDKINKAREQSNLSYKGLSKSELIKVLKSFSKIQGITEFNEKGLPFDNSENISSYYAYNIPGTIYKKIFPDEAVRISRIINTDTIIDEKAREVIIRKGPTITEKRKYHTLLSLIEKEKYIQLVITTQGKYTPDVELVTISRKDFSQIDNISLFGGIYDSNDINYWHSKFNKEYEEIFQTHVKNTVINGIKLDTVLTKYIISNSGKIVAK